MKKTTEKIKKLSDKQLLMIILAGFFLVVLLYVLIDVYYDRSGTIITEYITLAEEEVQLSVDGFVIMDDSRKENGKNISVLKKSKNGIYTPTLNDGESIAKNAAVAYVFDDEADVDAYNSYNDIVNEIELLSNLQDKGNIGCLDVTMLNTEISALIRDYVYLADSNKLSGADELADSIDYKISARQIAVGEDLDFSKRLKTLTKQKNKLEKQIADRSVVRSPLAGYFISVVDGFEGMYDYDEVTGDGLTPSQVDKLLASEIQTDESAFGKIIGEHIWYYTFNLPFTQSTSIKSGRTLKISFPEAGISDLTMTVKKVNREGERVAVILKCITMNEKLLGLRKENAVITVDTHSGYKINKDALVNVDGFMGVYVLSGKLATFKPITVLYDADNYVIALPDTQASYIDEDGDKQNYPQLKQYDKVIVKGRNLYDGKVVG